MRFIAAFRASGRRLGSGDSDREIRIGRFGSVPPVETGGYNGTKSAFADSGGRARASRRGSARRGGRGRPRPYGARRGSRDRKESRTPYFVPRTLCPDQRLARDLADRAAAGEAHGQLEVGDPVLEQLADARLAGEGEGVDVRAADQDGAGAQGDGLEDVGAAADAAVHQHGDAAGEGLDDGGEGVEGGDGAVHL